MCRTPEYHVLSSASPHGEQLTACGEWISYLSPRRQPPNSILSRRPRRRLAEDGNFQNSTSNSYIGAYKKTLATRFSTAPLAYERGGTPPACALIRTPICIFVNLFFEKKIRKKKIRPAPANRGGACLHLSSCTVKRTILSSCTTISRIVTTLAGVFFSFITKKPHPHGGIAARSGALIVTL